MPGKGAPAHSIRPIKTTLLASALMVTAAASTIAADQDRVSFKMVVPKGASACLPNAQAQVQIASSGDSEELSLFATGLPPNTSFDLFVIQVPTAPFGLSWYQGDVNTGDEGNAFQHFRGRFSIETFIVGSGVAPAPVVFTGAFSDGSTNPIQTYHLGLWFNSPTDAVKAGCPGAVTPLNGEHKCRHSGVKYSELFHRQGTVAAAPAVAGRSRMLRGDVSIVLCLGKPSALHLVTEGVDAKRSSAPHTARKGPTV